MVGGIWSPWGLLREKAGCNRSAGRVERGGQVCHQGTWHSKALVLSGKEGMDGLQACIQPASLAHKV